MRTPRTWNADISWIHDAGFSGYSLNAAPGILRLLRESPAGPGTVVDLGCGSGMLARQLGFAGHDVVGIDQSESMLRLARKNAPAARFVRGDLLDCQLPRCVAVVCIGEALSFAAADDTDGTKLRRMLSRAWKALKPGGFLLVDYAQNGRLPGGMPRQGHWVSKTWTILVDVVQSEHLDDEATEDPDLLVRSLVSFRQTNGNSWRRTQEIHRLRLFDGDRVPTLAQRAGFAVSKLTGIGGLKFRSGHAGILARRNGTVS